MRGSRLLTMFARTDRDYGHSAPPRSHRHFNDHRANAAGRNNDKCVSRAELETHQNLFGVAVILFGVWLSAKPGHPNDWRVVRKLQFDQRHEAMEAPLPRRHLLAHHT